MSELNVVEFVGNPSVEREREEKEKERKHELELKQLELTALQAQVKAGSQPQKYDLLKYVKLVPQFHDTDPEAFFREFESTANHFEIKEEDWVWLIKPKLSDKALTVCTNIEDHADYENV